MTKNVTDVPEPKKFVPVLKKNLKLVVAVSAVLAVGAAAYVSKKNAENSEGLTLVETPES